MKVQRTFALLIFLFLGNCDQLTFLDGQAIAIKLSKQILKVVTSIKKTVLEANHHV